MVVAAIRDFVLSPPSMELIYHPVAAASIDAFEFELICHANPPSLYPTSISAGEKLDFKIGRSGYRNRNRKRNVLLTILHQHQNSLYI